MADTNVVILTGRMGGDPELRYVPATGTPVCKFSVASTTGFGDRKKTHWFRCVAWGKVAEFISQYFAKGNKVTLSGQIGINAWEKDGVKHNDPEITVRDIENHAPWEQQGGGDQGQGGGFAPPPGDVPTYDIPF